MSIPKKVCNVEGCFLKHHAKGLCNRHYSKSESQVQYRKIKNTSIRNTWVAMVRRCTSTSDPSYSNYGGRGINICEKWLGDKGFENFCNDMGEKPSKVYSIDRIDVNGNYEPDNCRWADHSLQMINRRMFKNNKSGVTGVFIGKNGKFLANLRLNGRMRLYKEFTSLEEAVKARKEAELTYFSS